MYRLFKRLTDGLAPMAVIFTAHFKAKGDEVLTARKARVTQAEGALQARGKYIVCVPSHKRPPPSPAGGCVAFVSDDSKKAPATAAVAVKKKKKAKKKKAADPADDPEYAHSSIAQQRATCLT